MKHLNQRSLESIIHPNSLNPNHMLLTKIFWKHLCVILILKKCLWKYVFSHSFSKNISCICQQLSTQPVICALNYSIFEASCWGHSLKDQSSSKGEHLTVPHIILGLGLVNRRNIQLILQAEDKLCVWPAWLHVSKTREVSPSQAGGHS